MTGPYTLPTEMRAYRLKEFGSPRVLQMRNTATPAASKSQVLVKVVSTGVCGQDVMRRSGQVDKMLGAVIGHEIAGTVVAVGSRVTDFKVGDRVTNTQRQSCHRCAACLAGRTVLCPEGVLYGEALDGGYAEYVAIDELSLARIPDGVSFDHAAVAACAVGTGLHALRLAEVVAGERVLVTGASGGVGIHALQLARCMGAEVVAVTTTAAKVPQLEGLADHVLVMQHGRFDSLVRNKGLQPHVVLDLTAAFTMQDSLRAVQRGGRVVIVGNLENRPVEVLPAAFIIREFALMGSKACTRADLEDSLRFIERGLVQVQLHGSMGLHQAREAHELVESGAAHGRVVLHP